MAQIVAAVGVPHTPQFPELVKDQPEWEIAVEFSRARAALQAASPDVIVLICCDHVNAFFLDNWPTFCVYVGDEVSGPSDEVPGVSKRTLSCESVLAQHILRSTLNSGFDPSVSQHLELDHSGIVPLYFLDPEMKTSIVPVFVNGILPPLPSARRCFEFGRSLAASIESWDDSSRVALVTSGAFSLEVAGTRCHPGELWGVPDLQWAVEVADLLRAGEAETLISLVNERRILSAGNVAGEVLAWITMLGAAQGLADSYVNLPKGHGQGFGVWDLPKVPS